MNPGKGVPKTKMFTALLITLLLITLFAARARAAEVTLTWDPNPDTNVTGSFLYYGPVFSLQPLAFSLTNRLDCGPTNTITVTGLATNIPYAFVTTAYNTNGLESDFSPVLTLTLPLPPLITDHRLLITTYLDTTTNQITWLTMTQWTIQISATNAIQYFRPRASITQTN